MARPKGGDSSPGPGRSGGGHSCYTTFGGEAGLASWPEGETAHLRQGGVCKYLGQS